MKPRKVSASVQFFLFMLLQVGIACFLWLFWRDRPSTVLDNFADAGALLSWIPVPLHLFYRWKPKGIHRLRWQIPDYIGLAIGWAGYFVRLDAVEERSWSLSNRGSILEIVGGLIIIYALVVLLRTPKNER